MTHPANQDFKSTQVVSSKSSEPPNRGPQVIWNYSLDQMTY